MIHWNGKKPSVSPRDCALLFGVPLERSAFLRKMEGPRDGNFAEAFRASSAELAWTGYAPLAERLRNLADEVEDLGVSVYREMTLETLAEAAKRGQVTVVSHSRSAAFRPADIVDARGVRDALAAHDGKVALPEDAAGLAGVLNSAYLPKRDGTDDGVGAPIRFQMELAAARRRVTDQLPGAFRGGAGVEFANGFEPFEALAAQFDPGYRGVIDLIVCNSLLAADVLHRRCPHSLVVGTSDLTFPETRVPFYMATMRLLARRPQPYDDAVQELKTILRREFK